MSKITVNGHKISEGLYEDICNAISTGYTLEEELEDIRKNWQEDWGDLSDALYDCEKIWDDLKAEN